MGRYIKLRMLSGILEESLDDNSSTDPQEIWLVIDTNAVTTSGYALVVARAQDSAAATLIVNSLNGV